jgi:hypothetical protein
VKLVRMPENGEKWQDPFDGAPVIIDIQLTL